MFIAQSVLHSFIILIIIEITFYSWEIGDHLTKFRYRLLVLALPIFTFPFYQMITPDRGSMYFRENIAIFNINRWLAIKIWEIIPVHFLFFALLFMTSLIFFLQEILPIMREKIPAPDFQTITSHKDINAIIGGLCEKLNTPKPSVQIIDEAYPILFTAGIKNHTILLSRGLLDKLTDDELESALAHEIVHIGKGSNIKTQIIYILRMLMFYNPVSLIEFRRLVQDDEFICDNITVSVTKKPDALTSALKVFYSHPKEDKASKISVAKDIIESHSHNLLLKERILKIEEKGIGDNPKFGWGKYILIIIIILKINYMVV